MPIPRDRERPMTAPAKPDQYEEIPVIVHEFKMRSGGDPIPFHLTGIDQLIKDETAWVIELRDPQRDPEIITIYKEAVAIHSVRETVVRRKVQPFVPEDAKGKA